ncbi:recombinase family protein [Bacillus cereus]|uniref:recombinase family protein n=1 Tax=Bacillus cereus TaxID=1396 RepID=UPI003D010B86
MNQSLFKIAIYTRVSTEEQAKEGFSLGAQEDILKKYAESNNFEVYGIYSDDGYSGKNYERPEIQRLFKHLYEGKFQAILVKSVDRISRRLSDISKLLDDVLLPNNCRLLVSDNNLDSSTLNGSMFINFLGTFAQYERGMIIERVKTGMEKRAEQGYWNGGIVLGYDNVNKRLVINKEEASIVRRIFKLRAIGKGYKAIAHLLNEAGYRSKKGKLFSNCTVKTILENEIYIGKVKWGKRRDWNTKRRKGVTKDYVLVEGKHDAIISVELWVKVQVVNNTNRESVSKNRNFNGDFILSGILRCPACGAGTVMSKSKKRDGSGYYLYYMCQAFASKGVKACKSNLIGKENIEKKVLQKIRELLSDMTIVDEVLNKIKKQNILQENSVKDTLLLNKKGLHKKKSYLDKLNNDYFSEKIRAEVYNMQAEALLKDVADLEEKGREIEREYEDLKSETIITKETVNEALKNFNNLFDNATYEQRKMLIRTIIKKIEVEPNRKDLRCISFWFDYDDALLLSKTGGTVPQIKSKT